MKIVVAVDGSEPSARAVEWCAKYAEKLGAEVIAVHAIEQPVYPAPLGLVPEMIYPPVDHEKLQKVVVDEWCSALGRANVTFKPVLAEGYATNVVCTVAEAEDADLVVVGRRGRGGFAELMLGSTSHQLAHHVGRPLVIVP